MSGLKSDGAGFLEKMLRLNNFSEKLNATALVFDVKRMKSGFF